MTRGKRRHKVTRRRGRRTRRDRLLKYMTGTGVVALILLALALHHLWAGHRHPTVEIDHSRYPVMGVDISHNNGTDIDFAQVRKSGIAFVYIKASEGKASRDATFGPNCRKARQAGLKVGAYHFYRKGTSGRVQAQNFMQAVSGTKLDLPLVIDLEDWLNDHAVHDQAVARGVRDMIDCLQSHGKRVMVYTNLEGYKKWVKPYFMAHDVWLCAFDDPEKLDGYHHVMQQYSHWGTVDGIDGEVDLNIFNGSRSEWQRWLDENVSN